MPSICSERVLHKVVCQAGEHRLSLSRSHSRQSGILRTFPATPFIGTVSEGTKFRPTAPRGARKSPFGESDEVIHLQLAGRPCLDTRTKTVRKCRGAHPYFGIPFTAEEGLRLRLRQSNLRLLPRSLTSPEAVQSGKAPSGTQRLHGFHAGNFGKGELDSGWSRLLLNPDQI